MTTPPTHIIESPDLSDREICLLFQKAVITSQKKEIAGLKKEIGMLTSERDEWQSKATNRITMGERDHFNNLIAKNKAILEQNKNMRERMEKMEWTIKNNL